MPQPADLEFTDLDWHINDPDFARAAAGRLIAMLAEITSADSQAKRRRPRPSFRRSQLSVAPPANRVTMPGNCHAIVPPPEKSNRTIIRTTEQPVMARPSQLFAAAVAWLLTATMVLAARSLDGDPGHALGLAVIKISRTPAPESRS